MKVKLVNGSTYTLSKEETETNITMNDADAVAEIGTWQATIIRRLDTLAERYPALVEKRIRIDGQPFYCVPKSWVKVNPPRQISEETRKKLSERLKSYR